jgi:sec-independent protein translocase protein TatA
MNSMLAVLGLSGGELVVVVVAILILFGSKKIPEFAKGLGKGLHEFKKASREVTDEIERAGEEPAPAPKVAPAPNTTAQTSTPSSAAPKV